MTKKHLYGGAALLVVLTLIVLTGVFVLQRYQNLQLARYAVEDKAVQIQAIGEEQEDFSDALQDLLNDDSKNLCSNLESLSKDIVEENATYIKSEKRYQKDLEECIDDVAGQDVFIDQAQAEEVIGKMQGAKGRLDATKKLYNDAVDAYEDEKDEAPQFLADLLGFSSFETFSNIPKPIESDVELLLESE